jgi:hypothetical protein
MHKVIVARTENSMGHVNPLPYAVRNLLGGGCLLANTRGGANPRQAAHLGSLGAGTKTRSGRNHYAESDAPENEASTRSPTCAQIQRPLTGGVAVKTKSNTKLLGKRPTKMKTERD